MTGVLSNSMRNRLTTVILVFDTIYVCSHTCNFTGYETEESQDKSFTIKYEVPYGNGIRTLSLSSTTLFADFLKALTAKMVVHPASIGYIPSFVPKSPKPRPKLLEDEESYYAMLDDIADYVATCRSKNRGKGVVKPFHIQIVDTSSGGDSKKTSSKVRFAVLSFYDLDLIYYRRRQMIHNPLSLQKPAMIMNTSSCNRSRNITPALNTKGRPATFATMVLIISTHSQTCLFGQCCWYVQPCFSFSIDGLS
jgi:hypothetical protein